MFTFDKKTIITSLVVGGAVALALGFVADKGLIFKVLGGAGAAFIAIPLAGQIAA